MTGVCSLGHVCTRLGEGGGAVEIACGKKHLWSVGRGGSGGRK